MVFSQIIFFLHFLITEFNLNVLFLSILKFSLKMGQNSSTGVLDSDSLIEEHQQQFLNNLMPSEKRFQKFTSQIIDTKIQNIILLKKMQKTLIKHFKFDEFFVGSISFPDSQIPLFTYFTFTYQNIPFLIIKLSQRVHLKVMRYIQSQSFALTKNLLLNKLLSLYQDDIKLLSNAKIRKKQSANNPENLDNMKQAIKPIPIPKMVINSPFPLTDSEPPQEAIPRKQKTRKISLIIKSPTKRRRSSSNNSSKFNSSSGAHQRKTVNSSNEEHAYKSKTAVLESDFHTDDKQYSSTDRNRSVPSESNSEELVLSYEEESPFKNSKKTKKKQHNIPQLNMNVVNNNSPYIPQPPQKHKDDFGGGHQIISSSFNSNTDQSLSSSSAIFTPSEKMSKNVYIGSAHHRIETSSKPSHSSTKRHQRRSHSVQNSSHRHHISKDNLNDSFKSSISESNEHEKSRSRLNRHSYHDNTHNIKKLYDFDTYITGSNGRRKILVRKPSSSKSSHSSSAKRSQSVPRNSTRIQLSRAANEFASKIAFLSSDEEDQHEVEAEHFVPEKEELSSSPPPPNVLSENESDEPLSFFEIPPIYKTASPKEDKKYADVDVQNVFSDSQPHDLTEPTTANKGVQIEQEIKKDQSTQNDNILDKNEIGVQNYSHDMSHSNQSSLNSQIETKDIQLTASQDGTGLLTDEEDASSNHEKSVFSNHNSSKLYSHHSNSIHEQSSSLESSSKDKSNSNLESSSQKHSFKQDSGSEIESSSISHSKHSSRNSRFGDASDSYLASTTSGEYGLILCDKDRPEPEVEVFSKTRKGKLKRKRLIKNDEIEMFAQSPRSYGKVSQRGPQKRTEDEKNQMWDSISSSHKNKSKNDIDSSSQKSSKRKGSSNNSRIESDKGLDRSSNHSSVSSHSSSRNRSTSVKSDHRKMINHFDEHEIHSNRISNSSSTQSSSIHQDNLKIKTTHNHSSSRRSQSVSSRRSKT